MRSFSALASSQLFPGGPAAAQVGPERHGMFGDLKYPANSDHFD